MTEVFFSILESHLRNDFKLPVRYRNQYSDRSYFVVQQKIIRNTGSLSGRVEQSSEIRPGTASYRLARSKPDNHYYCRNVRRHLRKYLESVYRLYQCRSGKDQTDIYTARKPQACAYKSCTAFLCSGNHKQYEVNIGLCLVGVIIGEFLAAKSGLGYLIIYSSQVFKMDWLLMSIILLCIMAMGLYALINVVENEC